MQMQDELNRYAFRPDLVVSSVADLTGSALLFDSLAA
jgi:hypothetical protein